MVLEAEAMGPERTDLSADHQIGNAGAKVGRAIARLLYFVTGEDVLNVKEELDSRFFLAISAFEECSSHTMPSSSPVKKATGRLAPSITLHWLNRFSVWGSTGLWPCLEPRSRRVLSSLPAA